LSVPGRCQLHWGDVFRAAVAAFQRFQARTDSKALSRSPALWTQVPPPGPSALVLEETKFGLPFRSGSELGIA